MRKQAGFTLIELVVVLVLLGILGAVATARFQDLSTEAATAAVQGVAAELSSAAAINYGVAAAGSTPAVDITTDTTCDATGGSDDVEDLFQAGAPPNGFTLDSSAVNCATDGSGSTHTCTVEHTDSTQQATATIICP